MTDEEMSLLAIEYRTSDSDDRRNAIFTKIKDAFKPYIAKYTHNNPDEMSAVNEALHLSLMTHTHSHRIQPLRRYLFAAIRQSSLAEYTNLKGYNVFDWRKRSEEPRIVSLEHPSLFFSKHNKRINLLSDPQPSIEEMLILEETGPLSVPPLIDLYYRQGKTIKEIYLLNLFNVPSPHLRSGFKRATTADIRNMVFNQLNEIRLNHSIKPLKRFLRNTHLRSANEKRLSVREWARNNKSRIHDYYIRHKDKPYSVRNRESKKRKK